MSEATQIHKAIIAVMREVGAIGKDSVNTQQNYKFRSIEDVYNRVQPLFAKHGIYSYPKVIDQQREIGTTKAGGSMHYSVLTVEYTFAAEDGSSISATVVGEGMDSGDKASNKAMAAAHKYAICQVLNIPYDVIDPDANTPEWSSRLANVVTRAQFDSLKKAWNAQRQAELQGKTRPQLREAFAEWLNETIGGHSPEMLGEADGWRHWTPEMLQQCQRALETQPPG